MLEVENLFRYQTRKFNLCYWAKLPIHENIFSFYIFFFVQKLPKHITTITLYQSLINFHTFLKNWEKLFSIQLSSNILKTVKIQNLFKIQHSLPSLYFLWFYILLDHYETKKWGLPQFYKLNYKWSFETLFQSR